MISTRYITPSLTVIPVVPQAIICGSDPVEKTGSATTESFVEEDFDW